RSKRSGKDFSRLPFRARLPNVRIMSRVPNKGKKARAHPLPKTRTPPGFPKGGVSGTLLSYLLRNTVLNEGLRPANTWAGQRFLTEHPARTAHRTYALGNAGSPVLRCRVASTSSAAVLNSTT